MIYYNTNRQLNLFDFSRLSKNNQNGVDQINICQVGSSTPFAIMREDKINYIDQCNKEIDIRLNKAIK